MLISIDSSSEMLGSAPDLHRDRALVQARDELRAEERDDGERSAGTARSGRADRELPAPHRPVEQRDVDALGLRKSQRLVLGRPVLQEEASAEHRHERQGAARSEAASAKTTVSAMGRNIFPSIPAQARIGR